MHSSIRTPLALLMLTGLFAGSSASGLEGPAPDFTLKSYQGNNLKLSELRGQVVLINFWASWCGPCRQEMPVLNEIFQRYEPMGFTLLGINVEEDTRQAERLLGELDLSFPVLFDPESTVSRQYEVIAMPSTVLVDRNGQVRHVHKGYRPGDEQTYLNLIRELIRE